MFFFFGFHRGNSFRSGNTINLFNIFLYTTLTTPPNIYTHDISSHNNCVNPQAMVCVTATVLSTLQTTTNNNDDDDDDVDDASHSHVIVMFTHCCRHRRW